MDSAALYQAIVETSPDSIWVFDLEGRTVYANPQIARLLGYDDSAMAELTVFDALDAAGRAQFAEHLEALHGGHFNTSEVECQFVRRDGSTLWVLLRESPLRGPDGDLTGVLHRISDYSERRQMLEALRTSQMHLAEAHRIARIGSWTWDVVNDQITGSPEIYELFGLDTTTFPNGYDQFLDMVHPDDRELVDDSVQGVLDGADDFVFVARVRARGAWMWTRGRGIVHRDASGAVAAMSGTHQDMSEVKESELALVDQVGQNILMQAVASAANEARSLNDVLGRAQELVLLHDDWERARGFVPNGEATGVVPLYLSEEDRDSDLAYPALCAIELESANRAFHGRAAVWDDERLTIAFPVCVADEVCAVVAITSAPPLFRHEMIQTMAETVAVQLERVAEREKAQREIADARDEAMEASRQKSEFVATMSHEIRTPLNGIIGLNDLLLRTDLDAAQIRLASGVQIASRALLRVVNDILDFSKIEAGLLQLERLDFEVRPVFEQVASVLAEGARAKGIELIVSCHPDVPEVLAGDPIRLGQVLANLVSNAVKFTERGEVYVRATAVPRHDQDGPNHQDDTTVLRVDVADTGIGIAGLEIGDLFDPFTQADTSTTRLHGGTGLGLAISKDIVEALGGRIGYEPNPGGGSIFSFTAVFGAPRGTTADPDDEYARTWLTGQRVLVVNDNDNNRQILEEQLARWQVRSASARGADDAMAALALAAAAGDPFDGALLDMAMPGRNGLDLAAEIRRNRAYDHLTLLMLTSYPTIDRAQVAAAGIVECLDKPVLAHVLRSALLHRLVGISGRALVGAPMPGPERKGCRVLVVEDNPVNQMVAIGMLESMGYVVETAEDGQIALEAIESGQFDAVLMDVQMPRMDGYAATREIRAREAGASRIPVIAMTAAAVEGERERCLSAGMDDFLTKPVDPAALSSVLRRWLDAVPPSPPTDPEEQTMTTTPSGAMAGLDTERLDMLRDLDPDNTTYLDRAIGNFMVNSRAASDSIRATIVADDADAMRQAAHKLAGSALNLGVPFAGEAARQLEFLGDTGTTDGAEALMAPLEESLERGRAALLAYQATYAPGGTAAP